MVAKDEHGPDIEILILNIKERNHTPWITLFFKKIQARMIIKIVTGSYMCINMFPLNDGISITIVPRTVGTGIQINYIKYFQIEFGFHAQNMKIMLTACESEKLELLHYMQ